MCHYSHVLYEVVDLKRSFDNTDVEVCLSVCLCVLQCFDAVSWVKEGHPACKFNLLQRPVNLGFQLAVGPKTLNLTFSESTLLSTVLRHRPIYLSVCAISMCLH